MKAQLIDGTLAFWRTVDRAKCGKYIAHLRKVIPKVIQVKGEASIYLLYELLLIFIFIYFFVLVIAWF